MLCHKLYYFKIMHSGRELVYGPSQKTETSFMDYLLRTTHDECGTEQIMKSITVTFDIGHISLNT